MYVTTFYVTNYFVQEKGYLIIFVITPITDNTSKYYTKMTCLMEERE